MTQINEYKVEGMTCNGCVNSVQNGLEGVPGVTNVVVTLDPPAAVIETNQEVSLNSLQSAIGKYKITTAIKTSVEPPLGETIPEKSIETYKPLILIVGFLILVTVLSQYPLHDFSFRLWMRHFMAGFFFVFSFFKLLNLSGFASSYSMYDIIAKKWNAWGYIYPFVELSLGILYLINLSPVMTNWITVVVLGISSIGVIESNINKRKIKCACLGDVFNLPMSTVTIIEDLSMVGMAGFMLYLNG